MKHLPLTFITLLLACGAKQPIEKSVPPVCNTTNECVSMEIVQRANATFVFPTEGGGAETRYATIDDALKQLDDPLCCNHQIYLSDMSKARVVTKIGEVRAAPNEPFVFRSREDLPAELKPLVPRDFDYETDMLLLVEGPAGLPTEGCLDEKLGLRNQEEVDAYEREKQAALDRAQTTIPPDGPTCCATPLVHPVKSDLEIAFHDPQSRCLATYYHRRPVLLSIPQTGRTLLLHQYSWPPTP